MKGGGFNIMNILQPVQDSTAFGGFLGYLTAAIKTLWEIGPKAEVFINGAIGAVGGWLALELIKLITKQISKWQKNRNQQEK